MMVIGMVTVFCILLIVIYGSRALISLVNRIAPSEQRKVTEPRTAAVLDAAVAQITGGKGHIVKITPIN